MQPRLAEYPKPTSELEGIEIPPGISNNIEPLGLLIKRFTEITQHLTFTFIYQCHRKRITQEVGYKHFEDFLKGEQERVDTEARRRYVYAQTHSSGIIDSLQKLKKQDTKRGLLEIEKAQKMRDGGILISEVPPQYALNVRDMPFR